MDTTLEFAQMRVFTDIMFWNEVSRRKLDEWKLNESPKPILGFYKSGDLPATLDLSYNAFFQDVPEDIPRGTWPARGFLLLTNSHDTFKTMDRKQIIGEYAQQVRDAIMENSWLKDPSLLNVFVLTAYVDLKKFLYYYWNCIPALIYPRNSRVAARRILGTEEAHCLKKGWRTTIKTSAFLVTGDVIWPLSFLLDKSLKEGDEFAIAYADTSGGNVPGWTLRNLLAAVANARPDWSSAKFVALRHGKQPSIELRIEWDSQRPLGFEAVGWERDEHCRLAPSSCDFNHLFEPKSLAMNGVQLNLRLIRWRLVPDLNLQRFTDLRCLILGSGTLGCNIARGLIAWGVHMLTFVDCATVSYSNPVRQSLFEFEDSRNGGKSKAMAAAEAVRRIYPAALTRYVNMMIPMPGHTVSSAEEKEVRKVVEDFEHLITEHDVILLLMDSREARWLPTLFASLHNKMAFSVALGFDSYVVIRHGYRSETVSDESGPSFAAGDSLLIPGSMLGCYFCSDVTAPGNSSVDRTLDQQCTVSRAGVSMAASGMAIELLAAVMQHPQTGGAPARIGECDESSTVLGATPHQIRAFISRFHQMTPAVRRFERCVACGEAVCSAYRHDGFDFLLKVFNDPKYLEKVSGLEQLHSSSSEVHIWEFDDNESVTSS